MSVIAVIFSKGWRKDFCLLLEPPIYIVAQTTDENPQELCFPVWLLSIHVLLLSNLVWKLSNSRSKQNTLFQGDNGTKITFFQVRLLVGFLFN